MIYSVKRKIVEVIVGIILLIVILLSVVGWSYGILQANIAGAYDHGILVEKNSKKAVEWGQKSANKEIATLHDFWANVTCGGTA